MSLSETSPHLLLFLAISPNHPLYREQVLRTKRDAANKCNESPQPRDTQSRNHAFILFSRIHPLRGIGISTRKMTNHAITQLSQIPWVYDNQVTKGSYKATISSTSQIYGVPRPGFGFRSLFRVEKNISSFIFFGKKQLLSLFFNSHKTIALYTVYSSSGYPSKNKRTQNSLCTM